LANFTSSCLDACDDAVTVTSAAVRALPVEEAGPRATVVGALVEQSLFAERSSTKVFCFDFWVMRHTTSHLQLQRHVKVSHRFEHEIKFVFYSVVSRLHAAHV
jgi:hypothetical protein